MWPTVIKVIILIHSEFGDALLKADIPFNTEERNHDCPISEDCNSDLFCLRKSICIFFKKKRLKGSLRNTQPEKASLCTSIHLKAAITQYMVHHWLKLNFLGLHDTQKYQLSIQLELCNTPNQDVVGQFVSCWFSHISSVAWKAESYFWNQTIFVR